MEVVGETDTSHKGYLRGAGQEISRFLPKKTQQKPTVGRLFFQH